MPGMAHFSLFLTTTRYASSFVHLSHELLYRPWSVVLPKKKDLGLLERESD